MSIGAPWNPIAEGSGAVPGAGCGLRVDGRIEGRLSAVVNNDVAHYCLLKIYPNDREQP
jgi:hypothetical protein